MRLVRTTACAALAGTVIAISACTVDADSDCTDTGTCGSSGDASMNDGANASDGGADGPTLTDAPVSSETSADGASCDLSADPKDAPGCVDEAYGAFVDGSADATQSDGSKAHPFATIAAALSSASQKRVYICQGTYTDNLSVTSGIALYGGFACGTWAYTAGKPKVAPASHVALTISGVSDAVMIEDLEIDGSADASMAGDTAIAAFVATSSTVTFSRVALSAGAGVKGADGAAGSVTPNYTAAAKNGASASGSTNGAEVDCSCADGRTSSRGGAGGVPNGASAGDGVATPAVGSPNGGATLTSSCSDGTAGANGPSTSSGAGASSSGSISSTGWTSGGSAGSGGGGDPGQGGGGGGAKSGVSSAGGGGACGGCGGTGGAAGGNGGSSFALLVWNSTVVINASALTSQTAGGGGAGGAGENGQMGGASGAGAACNGGAGGSGAGGSGGGGGAGGSSAAIAYLGTAAPATSMTTMSIGTEGGAGSGGAPGAGPGNAGTTGNPGAAGTAQMTLVLSH